MPPGTSSSLAAACRTARSYRVRGHAPNRLICRKDLTMSSARGYGHDETDEFETLAEAHRQEDGTIEVRVVQIDKRTPTHSTDFTPDA